jgi:hypothetical protein
MTDPRRSGRAQRQQTAHWLELSGQNEEQASALPRRQRRTEGDARPQKKGGTPEAEMIAKVSFWLVGQISQTGPGQLGQDTQHCTVYVSGCLGEVWMPG